MNSFNEQQIQMILQQISKNTAMTAQQSANQIVEIGSTAYMVGVGISLGMNFALGGGLASFVLCWLSWINVGYILGEFVKPVVPGF